MSVLNPVEAFQTVDILNTDYDPVSDHFIMQPPIVAMLSQPV
jgi:hypothetical protein